MMDDFSNHPKSISEIKADKQGDNAAVWTPRDAVIAFLRRIDSKEINPDVVVICARIKNEDGSTKTVFTNAGPDIHASFGVMEAVKLLMFQTGE